MATSYFLPFTFYWNPLQGRSGFPFIAAKVQFFRFHLSVFHFPFSVFDEFRRFRAVVCDDLHDVDAGVQGGGVNDPL